MKIKEIIELFERIAPFSYQESYDNSGLIVGNKETEITGILLCLDSTEAVINEAIEKKCNLVIAHHPIIFKGLKRINGNNYIEKTIIKAIKNDINIFAIHTNLDLVLKQGVNEKMAQKLGLSNLKVLQTKPDLLSKLNIYCPENEVSKIKESLFELGAGKIGNYSDCSFEIQGIGTFKGNENSIPKIGKKEQLEKVKESKIEVLVPQHRVLNILEQVKIVHPYEEMAYEIIPLMNQNQEVGFGVVGELEDALTVEDFLNYLKEKFHLELIKHTIFDKKIKKIAVCGGSGSFLINASKQSKVDAYITSDIKYHEFFDTENELLLCDIGHYESEISTLEIFYDIISEKKPKFAVAFCETITNPVKYYK